MDTFTDELQQARPALLRTARARLRNPTWAEDAVSETLLAALEQRPHIEDPARLRAWLFGVLRHKLVDQLRCHLGDGAAREAASPEAESDLEALPDPHPHADPQRRTADAQFLRALVQGLSRLPSAQAHVFVDSQCRGHGTDEICRALGITAGHAWVMLHRARRRLQIELMAFR